jgi:hypothetical protein
MKIKREIASVPVRSASETWKAIIALISAPGTPDVNTLTAAASIMESLIADEHPASHPITVKGSGDRVVIYCRYNEDALELGTDIAPLTWNATGGPGWKITAPTEAADVPWMNGTLKDRAPRITVHDVKNPPADEGEMTTAATEEIKIDWGVLGKS